MLQQRIKQQCSIYMLVYKAQFRYEPRDMRTTMRGGGGDRAVAAKRRLSSVVEMRAYCRLSTTVVDDLTC